jgi:hypothetical protein
MKFVGRPFSSRLLDSEAGISMVEQFNQKYLKFRTVFQVQRSGFGVPG